MESYNRGKMLNPPVGGTQINAEKNSLNILFLPVAAQSAETRNSNIEIRNKFKCSKSKTPNGKSPFRILKIRILILFRISDFVLRISVLCTASLAFSASELFDLITPSPAIKDPLPPSAEIRNSKFEILNEFQKKKENSPMR